jgi:predicted nucleic acid-binding protein
MQTVLLDTDYVIDFLRGKLITKKIIIPLFEENRAFLSILSVYELYAGMYPNEKQATDDFIQACQIESVTMEIAKKAGTFRFKHRQKGTTLSIVDCLISTTALVNGHQVATNNKKHYPESSFWCP